MAHFAEIDEQGVVLRVVVVGDDDVLDDSGLESEQVGINFLTGLLGGVWVQTSYNGSIRKQFAGIGYKYDQDADVFVAVQPFPSWVLDENHDWQPPIPMPAGGRWYWNEEEGLWVEIVE